MRTKGAAHQETRNQILKTARTLVLRSGHENLSLREIAREAGFSPASLYEYFPSKDVIVEALAREAGASLKLALDRKAKDGKDLRATLIGLGLAYVAWAKDNQEDFLLLFQRLPSQRRSLDEGSAAASPYTTVLEMVRLAHESGAVRGRDRQSVERLAYGLWSAAHGAAMLQLTHLAGFKANFIAADRALFEALIDGWST